MDSVAPAHTPSAPSWINESRANGEDPRPAAAGSSEDCAAPPLHPRQSCQICTGRRNRGEGLKVRPRGTSAADLDSAVASAPSLSSLSLFQAF